jgi:PKD repeat protein
MAKYFIVFAFFAFIACKKDEEKKAVACFSFSPDTLVKIGDTVFFSNCSENADTYLWDFGDGTTSNDSVPNHVYTEAGEYTVTLNVFSEKIENSLSFKIFISDQYSIDLKDTLIIQSLTYPGSTFYNLDVDGDNQFDITFTASYSYGSFMESRNESRIDITLKNGFEISIEKDSESIYQFLDHRIDTMWSGFNYISIPKMYHSNNELIFESNYSNSSINLISSRYSKTQGSQFYTIYSNERWLSTDYRYMVFRKQSKDIKLLAWLKVKANSARSIILNSSTCFINKDVVVIEE